MVKGKGARGVSHFTFRLDTKNAFWAFHFVMMVFKMLTASAAILSINATAAPNEYDTLQAASSIHQDMRIFVTAHSFHIFVADRLGPLAKAAGLRLHQPVGRQMIGGSSVKQHWNLPDENNPAKAALTAGEVDVLTMSPNWMVPDEAIELFTDLGLKHNPRMRVLVQVSWNAYDHHGVGSPNEWEKSRMIHNNEDRDTRSLDGLRAANANVMGIVQKQVAVLNARYGRDVIQIVPVGKAVIRLRELVVEGRVPGITKQSELFSDPIGHGKAPVLALATYCNFACLFGRSPEGLDDGNLELEKIHPDLQPFLQKIAWETVATYPESGVNR